MNQFKKIGHNKFKQIKYMNYDKLKRRASQYKTASEAKWAKPKQFMGQGKVIQVLNLELLSKGEGAPPTQYVNKFGYTFRLLYKTANGDLEILENMYDNFIWTLENANVDKGSKGILALKKNDKGWAWEWSPLTQDALDRRKQTPKPQQQDDPFSGFDTSDKPVKDEDLPEVNLDDKGDDINVDEIPF